MCIRDSSRAEREAGGVLDMDTRVISTITSHAAGYLDKEKETIVGFQTEKPFKRALMPYGCLLYTSFITQVASDVLFSKPVEKYGFRPFAVAAPLVSAAGLGLFAAAPILFPQRPFAGFCAGMFLFAAAGGLQELLLSPILDALPIPEERKARSMSCLLYTSRCV